MKEGGNGDAQGTFSPQSSANTIRVKQNFSKTKRGDISVDEKRCTKWTLVSGAGGGMRQIQERILEFQGRAQTFFVELHLDLLRST